MKLLDMLWIRKYYRTRDELVRDGVPGTADEMKEDIESRPNILEPLLQTNMLEAMANTGRVVIEDNVKLRDFRKEFFGRYSEKIPLVDASRYPSVPLPSSYAQPRAQSQWSKDKDVVVGPRRRNWTYAVGQKLHGSMIPQQRV